MYTIKDLKALIKGKGEIRLPLVLKYASDCFIAEEYATAICGLLGGTAVSVDSLKELPTPSPFNDSKAIYVYRGKVSEETDLTKDIIIVTNDITKGAAEYYSKYLVEIPDPTEAQSEEFIRAKCHGLDGDYVEWMATVFETHTTKLSEEISKISIFPDDQQDEVFEGMYENGQIDVPDNDTTSIKISSAIEDGDVDSLMKVLDGLDTHKAEYGALMTMLHNGFLKRIKVQMTNNPTQENTGLTQSQIWAIKHSPKAYTDKELAAGFREICGIDNRIRSGEFPPELTLDYLMIKILGKCA